MDKERQGAKHRLSLDLLPTKGSRENNCTMFIVDVVEWSNSTRHGMDLLRDESSPFARR